MSKSRIKRKAEKEGVDLDESVDKAFGDKIYGLSMTIAGGLLWGGLALLFFSVLMMLKLSISEALIIGCVVGSDLLCVCFQAG